MELISSRKVAIYLTSLQELKSECEMKAQATITQRGANALLGNRQAPPTEREIHGIVNSIQKIVELCRESGWPQTQIKAGLIDTHIEYNRGMCDWSSLSADLRNVLDMLLSEMWSAILVKVLPDYSGYVNCEDLIGGDFKIKFPSAVEDIREAGNCIAVDCGTAAVFHLMRAVEWGIRALSVELKVLDVPRKNATIPIEFAEWDKNLDQLYPAVEKKVNALGPGPAKQETQEFYFPLLFDIKGFKDAFRNHVMHTRKTYSQKAADDVMDYVRRFFILLSTRVSE
jgi:hypothetical protein